MDPQSGIAWVQMNGAGGIRGRVVNAETLEPMSGAFVRIETTGALVSTDTTGAFFFPNVWRGRHILRIQSIGFVTVVDTVGYSGRGAVVLASLARQRGFVHCVITRPGEDSR